MSTTLLDRADPTLELRPRTARTIGMGHTVLAELDELERAADPDWKPVVGRRERVRQALGNLKRPVELPKPIHDAATAPPARAEPRRFLYSPTHNLPSNVPTKPKTHTAPVRIRPMLHRAGRWAAHQMPPIPLLWRPMLKRIGPNALADDVWRAFWGHWDAFIDASHRSVRGRLELLRQGADIYLGRTFVKMRRTTEFHVRGAWEDYLGTFGALQDATATRIADELELLDMLAT